MENKTETNIKTGQWFVVQTLSGHEKKVKEKIEKQMQRFEGVCPVNEVLIPEEKVSEVKQGKKVTSMRKFFPGYLLININLYDALKKINEDAWHLIKDTQGVIAFVGGSEKPIPLTPREVENLMSQVRERESNIVPKMQFELGDNVRIKDGAFENFEGKIEEIDKDRGKLKILVMIFGRSTPVELEYWQVEKAV